MDKEEICEICLSDMIPDEMFPEENNMKCSDDSCISHKGDKLK